MEKMLFLSIWIVFLSVSTRSAIAQDTTALRNDLKERYVRTVDEKATTFNDHLDSYTQKMLAGMINQEQKMQKKVARVDSARARTLFQYSIDSLRKFESHIKEKTARISRFLKGGYFPYLDTVKQSLSFLRKTDGALNGASGDQDKLNASLASVDQMESKLATVGQINEFLQQRQEVLQSQLN